MSLLEFLAELATDTELMSAFRRAPRAVLSARNLNDEEQRAILSGDPIALRWAVAAAAETERQPSADSRYTERKDAGDPPDVPPLLLEPPPNVFPKPPGEPPGPQPMPDVMPPHHPGPPSPNVYPPPGPLPKPIPNVFPKPPGRPPGEPEPQVIDPHFPGPVPNPKDAARLVNVFDSDLDISQDAVMAGLRADHAVHDELSGVWSGKGLTVVGMGMRAGLHMTIETRLAIEQSARLLYLASDPVSEACIRRLNPAAVPLGNFYQSGKPRIEIYEAIIARILGELEEHGDLCVAFYGHPGVLTYPAWESIRRARATGKRACLLPAISTEDTLFADLGIDIGRAGLQSFEATRFLYYKYNFDSCVGLLLWQLSVLGENEWNPPHPDVRPRLQVLADYLEKFYGPDHEVFLYHAPQYPTSRPLVERVALRELPKAEFISISTLYVPPTGEPQSNEEIIRALEQAQSSLSAAGSA